jgi:hypothetical protein
MRRVRKRGSWASIGAGAGVEKLSFGFCRFQHAKRWRSKRVLKPYESSFKKRFSFSYFNLRLSFLPLSPCLSPRATARASATSLFKLVS